LATDYSGLYSNLQLVSLLNKYEEEFNVTDETFLFKNLVNTSVSKNKPYYGWFRYREGYSGDLVKELIKRSFVDPEINFVADPMVGSGSTLVASKELGVDSIGLDVNPFAIEAARTKIENYSSKELSEIDTILDGLNVTKEFLKKDINNSANAYFSHKNFSVLQSLQRQINSINNVKLRSLFRTAWLSILEDCSNRKKDGNGLATRDSKVNDVMSYYRLKMDEIKCDLCTTPLPKEVISEAINESAFNFSSISTSFSKKTKKTLKAIIFSPPYANSFDYFESYKIELLMGGYYTPATLQTNKKKLIRNYRISKMDDVLQTDEIVNLLCNEIAGALPKKEKEIGKKDSRTRLMPNMLRGYFYDMERTIIEFSKSLAPGGKIFIVVDQSAYVGVIIPTDIVLAHIAKKHGFNVCSIIKCRRANTSGQQIKKYPYLRTVLRESIVELERV